MKEIEIHLFGYGKILAENKEVNIPAGKLTAIIYYLSMNKSATRQELMTLLWPDSNERQARSSLRNALHKIRSSLGDEFIKSPNRTVLELNSDVSVDVDIFKENPRDNLHLYDEFLRGFFIKDLDEWEFWVIGHKNHFENIYVSALEDYLKESIEAGNLEDVEEYGKRLISIDEYNNSGYLYLMEYYFEIKRYDKVINTYYRHKEIVDQELGIPISESITDIKNRAIELVEKPIDSDGVIPHSREYELDLIKNQLKNFANNQAYFSVLLSGEYGAGKTTIKNHLIKQLADDIEVLEIKCLPIDSELLYSIGFKFQNILREKIPYDSTTINDGYRGEIDSLFDDEESLWSSGQITEKKENYDNSRVFNIINKTLNYISEDQKYVIVIEDIQWLDKGSIHLLSNLLMQNAPNLFFIVTLGDEPNKLTRASLEPLIDHKIIEVRLSTYTKDQISVIVRDLLKDKVSEEFIDNLYKKTRGNPYFVYEYIRLYNNDLTETSLLKSTESILQEKLQILTQSQWDIVNILSVYDSEMELDYLMDMTSDDPYNIITDINVLIGLNIIEERVEEDKSYIDFTYSIYRNYIYENLNNAHRRVIHSEIAKNLDRMSSSDNDIDMDIRLKHHYTKSGDLLNALKHEINILSYHLYFNHEVFPDLYGYSSHRDEKLYSSNEKSKKWLKEIESAILDLKLREQIDDEFIREIELKYLVIKGRFLIRIGDYPLGKKALRQVINISRSIDNKKYELLAIKQIIVANIQKNDTSDMVQYINQGIKLAKELDEYEELGILYRLYGLYYLMEGELETADKLFDQALEVFLNPRGVDRINKISIAAIYNYKAEIYNAKLQFDKGLKSLNKAINLCADKNANCISFFYINAGVTSFLMGDYSEMSKYFTAAMDIVDRFDSYWKVSMLYGFLALVEYIDGNYSGACNLLEKADVSSGTINDPRDLGVIYFIKTYIKKDIEDSNGEKQMSPIGEYLKKPSTNYYIHAKKYLFEKRDYGLINYMEENLK